LSRRVIAFEAGSIRTTRAAIRSDVQTEPAAESTRPDEIPTLTLATGSGAAEAEAITASAARPARGSVPPTILFEVFWTQQKRKRLIEVALAGIDLPPEDYPFYVTIGADGPLTPTGLAELLDMPLSTVIFRVRRLERRGHVERIDNPDDGRSFLIRLTRQGRRLLRTARPRFRAYAEAVEARLGSATTKAIASGLVELRTAIDEELAARRPAPPQSAPRRGG